MARRRKGKDQTGEEILQQISESTGNTAIKSSVDQVLSLQKKQAEEQKKTQENVKATKEAVEELIDLSKEEIRFQNRRVNQRQGKTSDEEKAPKAPPPSAGKEPVFNKDEEPFFNKDIDFKGMAIKSGNFIMASAFPQLNAALEKMEKNAKSLDEDAQSERRAARSSEMMSEKVSEDLENVHLELKNMVAEQVKTNDLLSQILKAEKKGGDSSGGGNILGALGDMLGMGGKGGGAQAGKVAPKTGFLGKVGGAVGKMGGLARLAGGSLLGGLVEGVSEYSESGNVGRAASAGAGGLAGGAAGAVIGQMLIPIPGIGALIGGAIGSWLGGKGGKGLYDALGSKSEQESRKENVIGSLAAPSVQQQTPQTPQIPSAPSMGGFTPQQGITGGGAQPQQMGGGDQIDQILATIKKRESGGNYGIQAKGSSASGAYQFTDSTWQSLSAKYGATGYKSAKDAPPEVQDKVARAYVQEILQQNNGDVSKVPVVWYTGNAQGKMSDKALALNNGMTPEMYQSKWMADFNKMGGGTQVASAPSGPSTGGVQMAGAAPGMSPGQSILGDQGGAGTFGGYGKGAGPSEADVAASKQGMSGMLPESSLVSIGGRHKMTPQAAQAYESMKSMAAQEGISWGITDSYRSYQEQVAVAQKKGLYSQGGLAATPGKSNHGWGLAVDLNLDNKAEMWLRQNARRFGFKNIPRERWHWEFAGGGDASMMAGGPQKDQQVAKAGQEAEPVSGAAPAKASSIPDAKAKQPEKPEMGAPPPEPTGQKAPQQMAEAGGAPVPPAPTKGVQLAQASKDSAGRKESPPAAATREKSVNSVPGTSDKGTRNDMDDVGYVEPIDARSRFNELFGMA